MAESSVSKGFGIGCGLILALVAFAIGAPLACTMCTLGAGAASSSATSSPRTVRPSATPRPAVPDLAGAGFFGPLCGVSSERYAFEGAWACREREAAADWDRCLPRRAYTDDSLRGCPGAARCCPEEE